MDELASKQCRPCEGGTQPMNHDAAQRHQTQLSAAWSLSDDGHSIRGEFAFKNYYQTTAFVNAVAWVAHRQDHHPDITFGYKNCSVVYSTHAIGGLSENDFICAARVDALLQ